MTVQVDNKNCSKVGGDHYSQAVSDRTRKSCLKLQQRRFRLNIRNKGTISSLKVFSNVGMGCPG